jgi:hypothetical protein
MLTCATSKPYAGRRMGRLMIMRKSDEEVAGLAGAIRPRDKEDS